MSAYDLIHKRREHEGNRSYINKGDRSYINEGNRSYINEGDRSSQRKFPSFMQCHSDSAVVTVIALCTHTGQVVLYTHCNFSTSSQTIAGTTSSRF